MEAFRRKAEGATQRRQEDRDARLSASMSEAHWFYEKGLRLSQEGKTEEAKKVWDQLIAAFGDVAAEAIWVERARQARDGEPVRLPRQGDERWTAVRKALDEARQLEKEGKRDEAERIRKALKAMYKDDPSAAPILKE